MATAAKFVQLIPIFLAYLVPLDVDVVPVKIHQYFKMAAVTNQGAKNVKFTPNFTNFCSNVSCHIHI
jgi:hypothetical protein